MNNSNTVLFLKTVYREKTFSSDGMWEYLNNSQIVLPKLNKMAKR